MPEGEGFTALGALLIPAGCCLVDKNYGTGKTYGYFVGSNTFFERTCTCVGANEAPVRFSSPIIVVNEATASGYKQRNQARIGPFRH